MILFIDNIDINQQRYLQHITYEKLSTLKTIEKGPNNKILTPNAANPNMTTRKLKKSQRNM